MNILENELVRKYFCGHEGKHIDGMCDDLIAMRVLRAMQESIKKGERYLYTDNYGKTWEEASAAAFAPTLHPFILRLPDRFQMAGKKECEPFTVKCEACGWESNGIWFTDKFRELVKLARQT